MPKKTADKNNPWPDVEHFDVEDFKQVKNLLPPPEELRKAKIRVIGESGMFVHLSRHDMQTLKRRARKSGLASNALAAAVLHAYVSSDKGKQT